MEISESMKDSLVSDIEQVLDQERNAELKQIDSRITESDDYNGVSITLLGGHIPIRPLIEYIAGSDTWKLENIGTSPGAEKTECSNCGETRYHTGVNLFCVHQGEEKPQLEDVFTA